MRKKIKKIMKKIFIYSVIIGLIGIVGILIYKPNIVSKIKSKIKTHIYTNNIKNEHNKSHSNTNHSVWGIDISHHQQNINWNKLEANKPKFIFLKATEGSTYRDVKYKEYKKKANNLSIITGAYHFFSYQSSGVAQANNFIKYANLQEGDLPPVLDVEYRKNMPQKKEIQKELVSFIKIIEDKIGVKPIIYCEYSYFNKYLKPKLKGDYPLWISDFGGEPRNNYTFWQKTNKFKHKAFKGTVDYNVFNGSINDLKQLLIKKQRN